MNFSQLINRKLFDYDQNFLGLWTGKVGSGKSYATLDAAETTSPVFPKDCSRVVHTAREFIRTINSKKIKTGDIIIVDEVGTAISSRDYWKETNRVMIEVLQTFRHMNLGVFFSAPDISYIDSDCRKLFDYQFVMGGIDRRTNRSWAKPWKLEVAQSGPKAGKLFRKHPWDDGMIVKRVWFGMPSLKLRESYDAKADLYKIGLRKRGQERLEIAEAKEQTLWTPQMITQDILTQGNRDAFFATPKNKQRTPRIRLDAIMAHFNVGERTARKVRTLLRETLKKDANPLSV